MGTRSPRQLAVVCLIVFVVGGVGGGLVVSLMASSDSSSSDSSSSASSPSGTGPAAGGTGDEAGAPRGVGGVQVNVAASAPTVDLPVAGPRLDGAFRESFDGGRGFDRFQHGVFHRDIDVQTHGNLAGTWLGDHDVHADDCGNPHEHSHQIAKADRDAAFYVCREHLMTSIGHVDGYSIAWFTPDAVFDDHTRVAWDVNSTWLGTRQWWEVALVPVGEPPVTCIEWLPCDLPAHGPESVVVGIRDGSVHVWSSAQEFSPAWQTLCRSDEHSLETPEACGSKAIRQPWSVTDNQDGTLTVTFKTHSWTVPGSFPEGEFMVVWKDHSYTPEKDGPVAGFTWHWDNIVVE